MKSRTVALSTYTTLKVGGPAALYEINSLAELKEALEMFKEKKLRYYVLGKGSNLLVSDRGVDRAIIKLGNRFSEISGNDTRLTVGSAVSLPTLLQYMLEHELGGAEFLYGIPGTVGGALITNAGTKDKGISSLLKAVYGVTKNGLEKKLTPAQIGFSYRTSHFPADFIITHVELTLHKSTKSDIKKLLSLYRQERRKQPRGFSAGCIFKNPQGESAGKLIADAGLRNVRQGKVFVSDIHANFIIAEPQAKADDIWYLVNKIQKTIKEKYNISLELEIRTWGEF